MDKEDQMGQAESAVVEAKEPRAVRVTVSYLPAAAPFRDEFPRESTLEQVRVQAMGFFGVQDRTERDTYRYYLEFDGERITDITRTLASLIGERRRGAHFNLIEEITPGGPRG
jgi:hypothetical protein